VADTASSRWSWSRIVILGVAILELVQWLFSLLALFVQPLSEIPTSGFPALMLLLGLVVFPILAAWGATLAIKGQQLRRAALLVAVQPVVSVLIMVAFALTVMMGGF
jgi:threonine/homoserine/homoserine lactone efflux protein